MATGITPTIGLTLGADEAQNDNWRKLDALVGHLAASQVIPGDLLVNGNLEVTGQSTLDGPLTAPSLDTGTIITGDIIQAGGLLTANAGIRATAGGIRVDAGNIIFPDLSIDGTDLMKAATVQGVWVGASTGSVSLSATPASVASVATDASEEIGRWEIVLAQVTLRALAGGSAAFTVELRRDGTTVQTRALTFGSATLDVETPLTMARLTQVTAVPGTWSLWASVGSGTGASSFAQLHCLQLR